MFKLAKGFIGIIALSVIGLIFYFFVYPRIQNIPQGLSNNKETFIVKRVVDGDTFLLSNEDRVRLLGIDTPEKYESKKLEKDAEMSGQDKKTIKKLGKLASDYVKKIVEGKKVILEKEPGHEDRDRYGRLLRYIYLEDGTFVNAKIVRDGYATVYDKFPLSKIDEFRKYQREARENKRGLWGDIEGLEQFNP